MNKKKLLALLLCAALLVSVLCSCGSQTEVETDTAEEASPAAEADGTVVAVVNGRNVTEDEFVYFLGYYMDYMEQSYGEVEDWTADYSDGVTYEDFVKDAAMQWFVYAGAIAQQAERLGVELSEEDEANLESQWQEFLAGYETEEEAYAALEEADCTAELYQYILRVQYLNDMVFENMYGEYGAAMSDDECAAMTETDGYLMAKHILLLTTTTDEDGNDVELSDEEKAELYSQMEDMKAQLDAASDEEKEELFDTLMNEYSEDTGLESNPTGFLFQEGDLVDEFYQATVNLEIGGISDIVETSYGYHLIMREPVDYDVIPSAYSYYVYYGYDYLTLRYLCADEAFTESTDSWMERVEYSLTDVYDAVTIAGTFAEG